MSFVGRPSVPAFTLATLFTVAAHASPQGPVMRITAAANVTLREMPSANAAVIAQVPLGTELVDTSPAGLEKTWVRVRLADAREGWLHASLTRPLDSAWRWPVYDRIVEERLRRKGDGFPAAAELVAFIERVAPEYTDPDGRGRIELARLRAMSNALSAIPFRGGKREPYASWLAARKGVVTYDEPGGRWMIANAAAWDIHARQSATNSADDIGWFAVTNGLAGECEGYLPCYLTWRNRLHGEYLRRQPAGKYVSEAVREIKSTVDLLAAPDQTRASSYTFDRDRDCREVTESIDALSAAVGSARTESRQAALESLAAVKKFCAA